ncbi:MAG: bifunctional DNA-formamidopyrimidine glycosylase/DNA-(apurinic or apyrimidinic site) lyase [Desulfobulbus sp.]|nr:bifunctional DNA-formamidopyrimidine glycosylase/DNA-(apurinic or apyrimidinic site) lyase [Desulfobulbus sp.]
MPELPEVEVTRRGLLTELPGRVVHRISCSMFRLRQNIPRRLLQSEIVGQQVLTVDRRAKYLLVRMVSGAVVVIHLGMTGKLGVIASGIAKHKHDHMIMTLDNHLDLRFNDSRRFGSIEVWPAEEASLRETAFSQEEGIEPFGRDFSANTLFALARSRRIAVKSFLMNSKIIAGIGNIYANEILFATRINPLQPAHQISLEEWQRIVEAGKQILQQAIEAGGSTISDFLGTSGHPGYFQLQLQVYGRKGQACALCATPIIKTEVSGRATYYCPKCQRK